MKTHPFLVFPANGFYRTRLFRLGCVVWVPLAVASAALAQPVERSPHDLAFAQLPTRWDEALPLGNGMLGALVWQKGDRLRFSLDRADLWDLRPMKGIDRPEFSYRWVEEQVRKNDYKPVQDYFDAPYDCEPGPTKIPGAALEFQTASLGAVQSCRLSIQDATVEVVWQNGARLHTYVHAQQPQGWFRFENVPDDLTAELIPPAYNTVDSTKVGNAVVEGDNLIRLGYPQGNVTRRPNELVYRQTGWGGFSYEVTIRWVRRNRSLEGNWRITSTYPKTAGVPSRLPDKPLPTNATYQTERVTHRAWWDLFWAKSSLHVPDSLLEKQWYLEQYKFGSAARPDAPPISLQAVWTADNGRIPPWKGDYHHDLNTQLSYWPGYSGNHLEEGLGYFNHLDGNRPAYQAYTRRYFGTTGLAIPGVTTLTGKEMGGWIQYALSPTPSAWLAQHYYLHWRYSQDRTFLRERAYPFVKAVAQHLEQLTTNRDERGNRKLPLSSSPEINDNRIDAWFTDNTNYDLALMKFTFKTAAELATELKLPAEANHWQTIGNEFGEYALSERDELQFAPSLPYKVSHRHFSHLMAIHPLGLIKWEDGPRAQAIIRNSLALLDQVGPAYWCGYSWAWLGNLRARAKDGTGAAEALAIFARAFCSPNSFHLNGDQTKSGYSTLTYRPFTLEGNFAFAAGLQEMLLQSHAGFIEIFPAIPPTWPALDFTDLRAEGAFLVSAKRVPGSADQVKLKAERGGTVRVKLPFRSYTIQSADRARLEPAGDRFVKVIAEPGGSLILRAN